MVALLSLIKLNYLTLIDQKSHLRLRLPLGLLARFKVEILLFHGLGWEKNLE